MARFSCLTGRSPGSVFGLTRREEASGSLMTMPPLRVRHLNDVSYGSDLMGRSVGDPEERERELDEEDDLVSIRHGVQELSRRREKAGGGGYSYRGELPPSICSSSGEGPGRARLGDRPTLISLVQVACKATHRHSSVVGGE
ncbi:hypothetical protein D1007_23022 [Hordeum vulgare]|nr:hypothetical protein D1007_23022 [Hordeum vulgare]